MRPLPLSVLLLLTACGERVGVQPDGSCARLALPDRVEVLDVRFGERDRSPLNLGHDCRRKPVTIEIDTFSFEDIDRWRFRNPPFRQVQPDEERTVGIVFEPRWPTYRYESTLTIRAMGETYEVDLLGTAHPDQDGDGVQAEQAGGTDCNDLDPLVQTASEEVEDGIDNDCDGIVDEPFVPLGAVRITEILTQPDNARAEFGIWVELRNVSERTVNVRGWRIEHDQGRLQIVGDVILAPGARAIVGPEPDETLNGGIPLDGVIRGDVFADEPSRVALIADGVHSEALFDDWPSRFATTAALDPRASSGPDRITQQDAWCASTARMTGGTKGSPRAENDVCRDLDFDQDGYSTADGDCDDNRPDVLPGGTETWNDLDDNCDTWVDMMWIEDRVEDALTQVGPPETIAVGRLGTESRDSVALLLDDELAIVRPTDPWASRPAAVAASHSLVLDTLRGATLLRETVDLGGGGELAALNRRGVQDHEVVLLEAPTLSDADEADYIRVRLELPASSSPPSKLEAGDLDGDGVDEIVYVRDGVRTVDLPHSLTGTLSETDVLDMAWLDEPGLIGTFDVQITDYDLDGYEDVVATTRSAGWEFRVLPGGTGLGNDGSILLDAAMVLPADATSHVAFADVHGDGQADVILFSENTVRVWPGPTSGVLGPATTVREMRPRDRFYAVSRMDFDGDAFVEIVAHSSTISYPRAWFIDSDALTASGTTGLADVAANQWGLGLEFALAGVDRDGDGRDDLLFWAADPDRGNLLQQVPARP